MAPVATLPRAEWPTLTRVVARSAHAGALGELLIAVTVSAAFAMLVGFVSTNLDPRFAHRPEVIQQQFAILAGGPYPIDGVFSEVGAYQNRVLFPLALAFLAGLGFGAVGAWYLVLRLTTAFGAFLAVWYLLRRQGGASPRLAAVGIGLLAYELVFTFSQGWEHPTDFPDVALTSLWVWAALTRRRWTVLVVALVAAVNRESAAFAGVLWLVLYGFDACWKPRPRELAFAGLLSGASYATVLGARWLFGGAAILRQNTNVADVLDTLPRLTGEVTAFAAHPTPWSWPLLMLAMLVLPAMWIWINRSGVRRRERRVLLGSTIIALLSLPFSSLDEPRDFMTSIVLTVFVAVAADAGSY
jgi:hypothetical protein